MAEHEVHVTPVRYRVTIVPGECLEGACPAGKHNDLRHWNLYVERSRYGGWQVTDGARALGRDGTWDYPGLPDGASEQEREAWLARYRYSEAREALDFAREFAPRVTVNGKTAVDVLARHLARHPAECCNG